MHSSISLQSKIKYLKIKDWMEAERPREKAISKGISSLSNAEVLAILIGSGTKDMNALDLAKNILKEYEDDLLKLSTKTIQELKGFKGIGVATATKIVASLELATRKLSQPKTKHTIINSSQKAYDIIKPILNNLYREEFWVLFLTRSNRYIAKELISLGGMTSTSIDSKILFKKAFIHNAINIILSHNHPSGDPNPSENDMILTNKLHKAAKLLDLNIVDHIIFAEQQYYSFADNNYL